MGKHKYIFVLPVVLLLNCCTTSTHLVLPRNTDLVIRGERISADKDGQLDLTTMPFFWTGIDYELTRDGKVVQKGKMISRFRFVSVFWPPVAYLYWPKGFAYKCYDLTSASAEQCPPATPEEKEKREKLEARKAAKREARRLAREANFKASHEKQTPDDKGN